MEQKETTIDEIPFDREVTHDFETDRLYLMYMSGLKVNRASKLKYILSKGYAYSIIVFFIFVVIMGCIGTFLIQDKKLKLEAVHWTFLLLVGLSFMLIRYSTDLEEPLRMIKVGFFTYENEIYDERYIKRKKYHVQRVRRVSNFFLGLAISSGIFLSFIKQVKKSPKLDGEYGRYINTGLPIPMFLPFDTTTVSGFILGYFINMVAFFYLVVITTGTQQIILSFMEQSIAQLEILNISISNVQGRAYSIYTKGKSVSGRISIDAFYERREFQKCVSKCLENNIRHHQILLRYRTDIRRFIEFIFGFLLLSSVIIFAAIMFVILELQELSEATILLWLLSTEIVYVFVVCLYGELLSQESGRVFFTLYDTPWWNFDNNNKSMVLIMMSFSINPIVLGAPGLSSNLSLESFGDILARAYQFMSVVRNVK